MNFRRQKFCPSSWFLLMLYLFVSTSLQPLGFKYLMDHDPLVHLGCDHFSPRPIKALNQIFLTLLGFHLISSNCSTSLNFPTWFAFTSHHLTLSQSNTAPIEIFQTYHEKIRKHQIDFLCKVNYVWIILGFCPGI